MILRPRQQVFVQRCVDALKKHGNTLGVAPTASGKTLMLSAVTREIIGASGRGLILQHRDILVQQNREKFRKVAPGISTGVVDGSTKHFDRQVIFAMTDTLRNDKNLAQLPPQDIITIDEGHRSITPSNLKILAAAREKNPDVKLFITTATPSRSDERSLREVVDNVGDAITLGELVRAGHLVRPRTFVVSLGVENDLRHVKQTAADFDQAEVAKIMDRAPLTERIIDEWRKIAGDRKTVIFASTVEHAQHVADAYVAAGVKAAALWGDMPDADRARLIREFDKGDMQVLVSCALLIEGFDVQPVSCVVLLRPHSHKSVMVQCIGRGMRTVDPELYPGVVKTDCIVIDFGVSVLMHGSLEQDISLEYTAPVHKGVGLQKPCPQCESLVPVNSFVCQLCGFQLIVVDADAPDQFREVLDAFTLNEISIFDASPFLWEELWDGSVLVATAFDAWACCVFKDGQWHAVGATKTDGIKLLSTAATDRLVAISRADDFMREHGDTEGARKSKRWLKEPASEAQLGYLRLPPTDLSMTKYRAACFLSFEFNKGAIKNKLMGASGENARPAA